MSTGWPKNGTVFFRYAFTSSIINRFSKLFHCQNQEKCVIILSLKIPPHLKCVATLPCEMSSVFQATIENKTTSVLGHPVCDISENLRMVDSRLFNRIQSPFHCLSHLLPPENIILIFVLEELCTPYMPK